MKAEVDYFLREGLKFYKGDKEKLKKEMLRCIEAEKKSIEEIPEFFKQRGSYDQQEAEKRIKVYKEVIQRLESESHES